MEQCDPNHPRLSETCVLAVNFKISAILISSTLALAVMLQPQPMPAAAPGTTEDRLALLIENGGFAVQRRGSIIASRNIDAGFTPASIVKIITSLEALETLGPEYRFITSFYLTDEQNLYIQGGGDPLLTSEEVARIMKNLHRSGITEIRDIILDDSLFQLDTMADGLSGSDNPYDAFNGGLVVNFNTINISVAKNGGVRSAEEQTPVLPLMREIGGSMPPGTHRINITAGVSSLAGLPQRYAGELFRALQRLEGIAGQGEIRRGVVPEGLKPVYVHRSSFKLSEVAGGLLRFSNNFMANQLFLACGARRYGYPATWEKGRMAMASFLADHLQLTERDVLMVEGSGISRSNRVTIAAMLRVLERFRPYAGLLKPGIKNPNLLLKSGTLEGVYSYAGFFRGNDQLDPVVLILNQKDNRRDEVLDLLEKMYNRDTE